ncbi:hypothetical protein N7500_009417 [Penicillium coprophilum]|nr:hypothetical protein N7500_009417 [Penicillium coprophilum]
MGVSKELVARFVKLC